MEVKQPVGNLRTAIELLVIAIFLMAPIALIALIGMSNKLTLALVIVEALGVIAWWYSCYVAFWLFVP
jgi:hypothetical protein